MNKLGLSSFEKHKFITGELGSRVVKMFVSQFLNVGVLILINNAKMGDNAFANFINGEYSDIDVNWYRGVAPTIVYSIGLIYLYILFILSL